MFAIALEQNQYKTYILTDEQAQSRLEVVPERGGIITRWVAAGQEMLYLDAERFANPELTVRGGIPILFPICGNLPDNTYTHRGTTYQLKQHGFARDLPWTVTDSHTQTSADLTLTLSSSEKTRPYYPFDFYLVFTYRLQGNTLALIQQVTNQSPEPLPFSLGLHPYFWVPNKAQLRFEIPATEFRDHKTQLTHSYLNGFDFDLEEIDVIFQNPAAPQASVTDWQRRLKLTLGYEFPYSSLVFWTLKGKEFYCLEPWTAPRNAMNTGDRLTHLSPGESLTTTCMLTVAAF